jgi:hypothetical protein
MKNIVAVAGFGFLGAHLRPMGLALLLQLLYPMDNRPLPQRAA